MGPALSALSGRRALTDSIAEEDVETILVPPSQLRALIVAEAAHGERIVRALILRRMGLLESGGSGPVLMGRPDSPELLRLQNFLRRNDHPHRVVDSTHDGDAAVLLEQHHAAPAQVLVVFPDGSVALDPTEDVLARGLGMLDSAEHNELCDVVVVGQAQKFGAEIMIPAQAAALDCSKGGPGGELSLTLADGRKLRSRTVVIAAGNAQLRHRDCFLATGLPLGS